MDWARPARQVGQHAHNLALVSRLIASHGPVSRAELAQRSGLTKTTVTQLTGELLDAGLVRELGTARHSGPGRPATHLVINASGPAGVGMQIEADHVAGCLVDLTGRVRDRALRRVDDLHGDPAAAVKAAESVLRRLLAAAAARHTDDVVLWARSDASAERARATVEQVCGRLSGVVNASHVRVVTDLAGERWTPSSLSAVGGAPDVHAEILEIAQSIGSPEDYR